MRFLADDEALRESDSRSIGTVRMLRPASQTSADSADDDPFNATSHLPCVDYVLVYDQRDKVPMQDYLVVPSRVILTNIAASRESNKKGMNEQ